MATTLTQSCDTFKPFALASLDGKATATVTFPSGVFGTCANVQVAVKPVANSRLKNVKNVVDYTRTKEYGAELGFERTVLGTVVDISLPENVQVGLDRKVIGVMVKECVGSVESL